MNRKSSLSIFLSFVVLIFIICSPAILPVLSLQYDTGISSHGTINYSTPSPRKIFAVWLEAKWTSEKHTATEFNNLFSTLLAHKINTIYVSNIGLRTSGEVTHPAYSFEITRALKDYNQAYGTNLQAHVWFGNYWDDRGNPANLNDVYIQQIVLDAIRYYCINPQYPYSGVNFDWEFYFDQPRANEVVVMTNLAANTFPSLPITSCTGFNNVFGNKFASNVAGVIPMLYCTQLSGNNYVNWFADIIWNQWQNQNAPFILGVPAYLEEVTTETITLAYQGLQKAFNAHPQMTVHGLAMFDYDSAVQHNVWADWDKAVELISNS